nr:GntR family transcriptional regulator [Angustibacter aerolatus]
MRSEPEFTPSGSTRSCSCGCSLSVMPPSLGQVDVAVDLSARGERVTRVYRALRDAVHDGRLRPGDRLPATRALAADLGVSRTSVTIAYERLAAEGYVEGRRGSGTFVAATPQARRTPLGTVDPLRPKGSWTARPVPVSAQAPVPPFDLRPGIPDARLFPFEAWRRLLAGEPAAAHGRPRGLRRPSRAPCAASRDRPAPRRLPRRAGRSRRRPGDERRPARPRPRRAGAAVTGRRRRRGGPGVPARPRPAAAGSAPTSCRCRSTTRACGSTCCRAPPAWCTSRRRTSSRSARCCRPGVARPCWGGPPSGRWPWSRTTTTASSASPRAPSNRCTPPTAPAGWCTSARSRSRCCRRCAPGLCSRRPGCTTRSWRRARLGDWHGATATQAALARFLDDGLLARHVRRAGRVYGRRREPCWRPSGASTGCWRCSRRPLGCTSPPGCAAVPRRPPSGWSRRRRPRGGAGVARRLLRGRRAARAGRRVRRRARRRAARGAAPVRARGAPRARS